MDITTQIIIELEKYEDRSVTRIDFIKNLRRVFENHSGIELYKDQLSACDERLNEKNHRAKVFLQTIRRVVDEHEPKIIDR